MKRTRKQTPSFERLINTEAGRRQMMSALPSGERELLNTLAKEVAGLKSEDAMKEGLADIMKYMREGYRRLVAHETKKRRQERRKARQRLRKARGF